MKNKFIIFLTVIFAFTFVISPVSAYEEESIDSIGYENPYINDYEMDSMSEYYVEENNIQTRSIAPLVKYIIKNGKTLYKSIKYAPKYPKGFKAAKGKTTHHVVKNKLLLNDLRKIEGGKWVKVYKDGYVNGKKVSVHYFQSKSGLVYNVKTKNGWSN
ncbi:hypothetical protein [Staphylococcus sp. 17KM0847]|uniref:hypothetical protein n=1 Tax=Staphylococcus sp. 17KM0847 TaxID=2583989 RepID=UPI0015DCCB0E|nr:hypothetical protein [Staphylococcus sp. 17KM0847]QLK85789.1 hypothetical protein FGL66_03225 [Staphylococcus sp. 17KM0847]